MAEAGGIALKAISVIMLKFILNIKSLNEHGPTKRGRYLVRLLAASYNSSTVGLLILLILY
jgi:hypothetical protein